MPLPKPCNVVLVNNHTNDSTHDAHNDKEQKNHQNTLVKDGLEKGGVNRRKTKKKKGG